MASDSCEIVQPQFYGQPRIYISPYGTLLMAAAQLIYFYLQVFKCLPKSYNCINRNLSGKMFVPEVF